MNKNPVQNPAATPSQYNEYCVPIGQMNLIFQIRTLWILMGLWIRAYLFSVTTSFGNVDFVQEKLYGIPNNLYGILQLVFGNEAAQGFLNLMSQYIINLQSAIMGLKAGDQNAVNSNVTNMYSISVELSNYLNQINPFWNNTQWRNLLDTFTSLALQESVALMSGNYTQDIDLFDRLVNQAILLGDYMANGLVQYLSLRGPFPNQAQNQVR